MDMYSAKFCLLFFLLLIILLLLIIISIIIMILERFRVTLTANGKCSDSSCEFLIKIEKKQIKTA